jgi:hypothetical protein
MVGSRATSRRTSSTGAVAPRHACEGALPDTYDIHHARRRRGQREPLHRSICCTGATAAWTRAAGIRWASSTMIPDRGRSHWRDVTRAAATGRHRIARHPESARSSTKCTRPTTDEVGAVKVIAGELVQTTLRSAEKGTSGGVAHFRSAAGRRLRRGPYGGGQARLANPDARHGQYCGTGVCDKPDGQQATCDTPACDPRRSSSRKPGKGIPVSIPHAARRSHVRLEQQRHRGDDGGLRNHPALTQRGPRRISACPSARCPSFEPHHAQRLRLPVAQSILGCRSRRVE